ncbi:hypothetical protein BJ508DRAFT_419957 [Ascobolus immersus RN42]|uniref:Uncharacterized protein n=1 Tax=Ascobolus immersus RN42 TaxID=1160509 RepID=A0A3N4H9H0_ASCIM|nr:hypothetical protein BJ508DRAFT_419957 [Ascobolus immersus RN42]
MTTTSTQTKNHEPTNSINHHTITPRRNSTRAKPSKLKKRAQPILKHEAKQCTHYPKHPKI